MQNDQHLLHPSGPRRPWVLPFAISLCAIVIALTFSMVIYPEIRGGLAGNIDPDRLGELAANLAGGKGFVYREGERYIPVFDRAPVYPLLLAALLRGSDSFVPVQVFQCFLHGITCLMVFLLASHVNSRRSALLAQAVCAIHPMLVWYTARIWIETTHTFCVTLAALTLFRAFAHISFSRALLAGVVLGITSLTKSVLLPFGMIAAIVMIVQHGKRGALAAVTMAIVPLLMILPWTVRNYAESGALVPVHTSLGLNMVQGDAIAHDTRIIPASTLDLWAKGKAAEDSILAAAGGTATDPQGDRALIAATVRFSATHPLFAARRVFMNLFTLCYLSDTPLKSTFLALIQLPLFICAAAGAVKLWKAIMPARQVIILFAYFIAVHALIVGWARYSAPIVPVAVILAAGLLESRVRLAYFQRLL